MTALGAGRGGGRYIQLWVGFRVMGDHSGCMKGWVVGQVCGRRERTEECRLLGAITGAEGWEKMR